VTIPAKSGLFARVDQRPRRARRATKSPLAGAKIPTGVPRLVDSSATSARQARRQQMRELICLAIGAARCKLELLAGRATAETIACPRALFEGRQAATTIADLRARYAQMIRDLAECARW